MTVVTRALGAALVLSVLGTLAAAPYARLVAPLLERIAVGLGSVHGWQVEQALVERDARTGATVLRLQGTVRKGRAATDPWARINSHADAGAIVETPIVFLTVLIAWPARSARRRLALLALGLPVLLGVDALASAAALLDGFANAQAALDGRAGSVSAWERWSDFCESGGRVALAIAAAVLLAALAGAAPPRPASAAATAAG
jgi:hypothetical protein